VPALFDVWLSKEGEDGEERGRLQELGDVFNRLTADVVVRQIERAHGLIIGQLCKGQRVKRRRQQRQGLLSAYHDQKGANLLVAQRAAGEGELLDEHGAQTFDEG